MPVLEQIARFDHAAVVRMSGQRSDGLSILMKWASRFGDGYAWGLLGILIWFFDENGFTIVKQLATAFAIDVLLYRIIKKRFSRPRPFVDVPSVTMLLAPPDEFSFPSGHTAAAFVVATVVGVSLVALFPLLLTVAVVIGISRVYLGVHYPTDVIAGAALGAFSGAAGLTIF